MTDTQMTPFHYGDETVRTHTDADGQVWFVATDIARILGYKDASHALRGLEEDEKGLHIVETPGGEQTLTIVSEAGLYTLLVRARVEAAKPFRRWVTHEVLPSIRKTGSYSLPGASVTPNTEDPALVRAKGLMELVALAKDVISPDYLEAKARIVLARAMGDTPEIEASARPLYIQDYMREKGVSGKNLRSYAPTFGKYVKEAYKAERGAEPGKRFDETPSGQIREVCVYTEADRPLLDRIWNERYAEKLAGNKN